MDNSIYWLNDYWFALFVKHWHWDNSLLDGWIDGLVTYMDRLKDGWLIDLLKTLQDKD